MHKKILFVNGGKKDFGNRFYSSCVENNIECIPIRTHHNSYIVAGSDGVRYFHSGKEIDFKDIDYCFIRVRGRKAHMAAILSHLLKAHNVPFNDFCNTEHTENESKITQMVKFALHNIPIPRSVIFSARSYTLNTDSIQSYINYPCVLKTYGSKGNNVWKVEDKENLETHIKNIKDELMFVQDIIPNTYDVRALIFNKKLLGAMRRYSTDGFYNNVSKGGRTEIDSVSQYELELSIRAMEVLGLDFGGVDFVRTDKGIYFFEVNKSPQVNGMEDATGLHIPQLLVKEINDNF